MSSVDSIGTTVASRAPQRLNTDLNASLTGDARSPAVVTSAGGDGTGGDVAPGSDDVLSLVDDVVAAARAHGRDDQVARLAAVRARLARPPRHVVVVGEFKKGKSSLVNALLNARLCPTDADVATAVPSYLRHGDGVQVRALADNASPVGDVAGRAVDVADAEAAATGRHPGVLALDVQAPRDLLRDGLVLVDTPGVGGGLGSAHAAAALRALRATASVALVVSDAAAEYSSDELEFVRAVAAECPRVLAVVTKTDLYPQWRRVVEADRTHLAGAGIDVDVLPVSSAVRRAGLDAADDDLLVESGFPELTARIVDATDEGTRPLALEAVAAARSVAAQLVTAVADRRALLAGEAGAGTVAAWEADEQLAAALASAGARWQQVLSDRMGDLQAEIDVDLVTRVRRLRKEAVAQVADLPRQRVVADLGPWLQRRTNEELLDHVQTVRVAAEGVADLVAEQFGSAARQLRAGVSVAVDGGLGDAATTVSLDGLTTTTAGEPGMAALRGGATGAVVANALGLAFSVAVPVLVPVTVALSAALAGKSWHSARSAQERQLRVDLERAVVAYLDDVDVLARKDSRASVRRIQRHLRETFAERAAELHETSRRTAAQLRAAAEAADRERRAEWDGLEGEVERLRVLYSRCLAAVEAGLGGPVAARSPATRS